jgi:hypothetical protein
MVELSSFRSVLISGIGFFSDAYDLFIINIVMTIIEAQLKQEKEQNGGVGEEWEKSYSGFVSTGALIGAIIGQITFGFVADKVSNLLLLIIIVFFLLLLSPSFHLHRPHRFPPSPSLHTHNHPSSSPFPFPLHSFSSFLLVPLVPLLVPPLPQHRLEENGDSFSHSQWFVSEQWLPPFLLQFQPLTKWFTLSLSFVSYWVSVSAESTLSLPPSLRKTQVTITEEGWFTESFCSSHTLPQLLSHLLIFSLPRFLASSSCHLCTSFHTLLTSHLCFPKKG